MLWLLFVWIFGKVPKQKFALTILCISRSLFYTHNLCFVYINLFIPSKLFHSTILSVAILYCYVIVQDLNGDACTCIFKSSALFQHTIQYIRKDVLNLVILNTVVYNNLILMSLWSAWSKLCYNFMVISLGSVRPHCAAWGLTFLCCTYLQVSTRCAGAGAATIPNSHLFNFRLSRHL